MTEVTMTALDTVHISNVRAENLVEGDVFNVNETDAKKLEDAGLAKRGGKASDALNSSSSAAPRAETRDEIEAERGAIYPPIGAPKADKALKGPPEKGAPVAVKAPAKAKRK